MFFLNRDKETVGFYKKENQKLRKELDKALSELIAIRDFKEKYQELIAQAKEQVRHYNDLNCKYEKLISDCKAQLDSIVKNE